MATRGVARTDLVDCPFQLLYTNVFDTLKFPGNTWQNFDYHHRDAGGAIARAMEVKREKWALAKSSLVRSEEARATVASWGKTPMLPTYSAAQRELCHLEYGADAKCV